MNNSRKKNLTKNKRSIFTVGTAATNRVRTRREWIGLVRKLGNDVKIGSKLEELWRFASSQVPSDFNKMSSVAVGFAAGAVHGISENLGMFVLAGGIKFDGTGKCLGISTADARTAFGQTPIAVGIS